jgi:hypothetical protein
MAFSAVLIVATILFSYRTPSELGEFLFNLLRLFSGSTVYQFISGSVLGSDVTVFDLVTLAAFLLAFAGEASRSKQAVDPRDARLALGTVASLVAFFAVAGPRGVQPHLERYAIWCVVPLVLLASRGAAWWLEKSAARQSRMQTAMLGFAALLLVGFQVHYFDPFATTGGNSHLAFRTAEVDPKQAALMKIQAAASCLPQATIVSQCWWTRLPMQYLAAENSRLRVVDRLPSGISSSTAWFVELAGSDEEMCISKTLANSPSGHLRSVSTDRAGRAAVVVYAPRTNIDDSLKIFARPQFDKRAN